MPVAKRAATSSVLGTIDEILNDLRAQKRASDDASLTTGVDDPGGHASESSHPTSNLEGNTQPAETGQLAKEQTQEIEENVQGDGVDGQDKVTTTQDDVQPNIGVEQLASDDTRRAHSNVGDRPSDSPTSSPVNADDLGDKYASMSAAELTKLAFARLHAVLDAVANGASPAATSAAPSQAAEEAAQAAAAGYDLAALLGAGQAGAHEKQAFAQEVIMNILTDARSDAQAVGEWLKRYQVEKARLAKSGMINDANAVDDLLARAGDPSAQAAAPPAAASEPAPPAREDKAREEQAPSDSREPELSEEEAINELANVLMEAGVSPEEIEAIVQSVEEEIARNGNGGGDQGSSPSPMDVLPAGVKAARSRLTARDCQILRKNAAAVRRHVRAGRYRAKEAKPGTLRRAQRDEAIEYIRELAGR